MILTTEIELNRIMHMARQFKGKKIIFVASIATHILHIDMLYIYVCAYIYLYKKIFGYLLGNSARLLHIKPFLEGDGGE